MANTQGYEVVAELTVASLKNLLRAAWKNGGDQSDVGVIPEYINLPMASDPATSTFGPYSIQKGFIEIPQDQLDLTTDIVINGLDIKLGTIIQVEIANPPVDAAKLFNLTADVTVKTPIRSVVDAQNVNQIVADFTSLQPNGVTVNITSGDPIAPIINESVEQAVHKKYQDGTIPHTIDNIPVNAVVFTMTCRIDFYDDTTSATNKIVVTKPDSAHIQVAIPCLLSFYNITPVGVFPVSPATPMAINGTVTMLANYTQTTSHIHVDLSGATVTLTNIVPAAGQPGINYTTNKNLASLAGQNLDTLITTAFNAAATSQLQGMGPIDVDIPTLDQIEAYAALVVSNELKSRKQIEIYPVNEVQGTDTPINNVKPQALADGFAIAINDDGGANSSLLTNFVPSGRDFAIATSAQKVIDAFHQERDKRYQFPYTYPDKIDGKTVKLNSLDMSLDNGYLTISGNVTVVNAVLDSIDVSADFSQKVTLSWVPDGVAGQKIQHALDGDPDVDLGAAAWILTALIGFITLGIVGVIIGVVILAVVQNVASQIGGTIASDESGKFENAWPVVLDKIGNVEAHFFNPITIDSTGFVFAGEMTITATNQAALVDMSNSNGPYTATGNQAVNFNGGASHAVSLPKWDLGNGQQQSVRSLSYSYGKSGLYIANLQIKVNEQGGATTTNYAAVEINNVPPLVQFDTDSITIPEGQEVTLSASFTDDNWLDTHTALFNFGDNTALQNGTVQETNDQPQAKGTATIKHAWCDNGNYTVTLLVTDDVGGVGQATMTVNVTNVPPKIIAPKRICVLRHQNVHLEAIFTDPGWCDTHVATWDTGDGHFHMATIKERHMPPALFGYASSSHVYNCVGNYLARVTVKDDDGGEDSAVIIVIVTELFNRHFEHGFRIIASRTERQTLTSAIIANEWYPFVYETVTANAPGDGNLKSVVNATDTAVNVDVLYKPDEYINRDGQRAQVIELKGSGMAGIRQTVPVNIGWDYEFTTYYHLPLPTEDCKLIIGIDPNGGIDPSDTNIQWVTAGPVERWVHASVRVCAMSERITCFVGMLQTDGTSILYIDRTALFMIQPKYGTLPDRRKGDEQDCPIEEIEGHDFNRLTNYMSKNLNADTSIPILSSADQNVRFADYATSKSPVFLTPASTNNLADNLIKGITQVSGAIAKNLVVGTIQTVFPFLKKKG
jgi:hypothetical protein